MRSVEAAFVDQEMYLNNGDLKHNLYIKPVTITTLLKHGKNYIRDSAPKSKTQTIYRQFTHFC